MHVIPGKRKQNGKKKNTEINKEGRFMVSDKITTKNRVTFYTTSSFYKLIKLKKRLNKI